jgi:hypothetical protein
MVIADAFLLIFAGASAALSRAAAGWRQVF